ncbi:MAG: hypothetical protein IPM92_14245 [Saprospiraceae bacterium]|nr:hypothetical protein [Saprospiraceae bacterium]
MKNFLSTSDKIRRIILLLSIFLFLISLTQKGYCTKNNCSDSIILFLLGWFGMLMGGAGICWIANPVILTSWYFTKKASKYAMYTSLLATAICFSFLLFSTVSDNESGHQNQIISYECGYWLWCASAVVLLVGNVILVRQKVKAERQMGELR